MVSPAQPPRAAADVPARSTPDVVVRTTSPAGTRAVAAAIATVARPGDTVVLAGEMGAGKTAFAQGFGAALGVDEPITSPTFTLVHSYTIGSGRSRASVRGFHHADLYRLDTVHEVDDLGLAELAEDGGVVLVEWGDVVADVFGDRLEVTIRRPAGPGDGRVDPVVDADVDAGVVDDVRIITVTAAGPSWSARVDALRAAVEAVRPC